MKTKGAKSIMIKMLLVVFIILLSLALLFAYQSRFRTDLLATNAIHYYASINHFFEKAAPLEPAPNFTSKPNPYLNKPYFPAAGLNTVLVKNVSDLQRHIKLANQDQVGVEILLHDGVYTLDSTLRVTADHIEIRSLSGKPETVVIQGSQEKFKGIEHLFRVAAKHFVIDGITLQNARYHLVQIAGESDADYPVIRNCIMQDAYQQLLKVSYDLDNKPNTSADFGLVENCLFQYSDGIGPNYYIGGIDIHAGNSWIIRNNEFKFIASPGRSIAEHAIHVWNNAYNTIVDSNTFEDNDRAIGFGMVHKKHHAIRYSHRGGIISNNVIIHSANGATYADTGIILEDSPETIITDNQIWMAHDYPNAIEYRFSSTHGVLIKNNETNKGITARDGARAKLMNNQTNIPMGF